MVKKWVDNYRLCHWQEPKRRRWSGVSVFDVRKESREGFWFGGKHGKEFPPNWRWNGFLKRQRLGENMWWTWACHSRLTIQAHLDFFFFFDRKPAWILFTQLKDDSVLVFLFFGSMIYVFFFFLISKGVFDLYFQTTIFIFKQHFTHFHTLFHPHVFS